jgi:hypothetical protein
MYDDAWHHNDMKNKITSNSIIGYLSGRYKKLSR